MLLDEELRGTMEHAGAAIVAEAGPEREHVGLRREGKREDGRKAGEEGGVVLDDGGDAGLLEHDLGDPCAVRVMDASPRKRAGVELIPVREAGAEGLVAVALLHVVSADSTRQRSLEV